MAPHPRPRAVWRDRLEVVVFRNDTPAGRAFDLVLLVAILLSILVVVLESVPSVRREHGPALHAAEWVFTTLFTVEYILRLASARRPAHYAATPLGVVDLLSVLPAYISLVFAGAQSLLVIRSLRLLRVFRILKLTHYVAEASTLRAALWASRVKITVFLCTVLTVVVVVGALMYLIEGPTSGFTSIPTSMYWAIVTMTTVGYGDLAPRTVLGRFVASLLMVVGYGVLAVPTGIVSVELAQAARRGDRSRNCPTCGADQHRAEASYCDRCGTALPRS